MSASSFGRTVILELRKHEPRAEALLLDAKEDSVAIGLDIDGQFLPLFGLAAPTPKYNKMKLFMWGDGDWIPRYFSGTPKMLAERLIPLLEPLW